ncbi:hypothetical protein JTB14_014940 [Gonioctena quinquepunctata]|nr:hypothetical protein JTB14_014940 [Gonioctena quinquepunctata]
MLSPLLSLTKSATLLVDTEADISVIKLSQVDDDAFIYIDTTIEIKGMCLFYWYKLRMASTEQVVLVAELNKLKNDEIIDLLLFHVPPDSALENNNLEASLSNLSQSANPVENGPKENK